MMVVDGMRLLAGTILAQRDKTKPNQRQRGMEWGRRKWRHLLDRRCHCFPNCHPISTSCQKQTGEDHNISGMNWPSWVVFQTSSWPIFRTEAGVQFTTYNGWNASAGPSYGGLGVSSGVNQSSTSQVTIVKDQLGMIQVSMLRQDALGTEAGAVRSLLDLIQQTNRRTYTSSNSRLIRRTRSDGVHGTVHEDGLLPGADKLQGKDQRKRQRTLAMPLGMSILSSKESLICRRSHKTSSLRISGISLSTCRHSR